MKEALPFLLHILNEVSNVEVETIFSSITRLSSSWTRSLKKSILDGNRVMSSMIMK